MEVIKSEDKQFPLIIKFHGKPQKLTLEAAIELEEKLKIAIHEIVFRTAS